MTRVKYTDISPDGIRILVDWDKFTSGASFFVPTTKPTKAMQHIVQASRIPRAKLKYIVRIEKELYGIRVWRL